ncbi:MAG: ribonuclease H-like domain-containing protein [Deltaproteobacteria bacterium]|nr:ribonuclease H-like domain-containing protein [Nannocystaceae bacterium]
MDREHSHIGQLATIAAGGGPYTAFGVVRLARRAQTRQGKPFFELRIADRSRTVGGKIWSDAPRAMAAAEELKVGDHVKMLFDVEEYKGALQLSIRGLRVAREGEPDYDPGALLDEGHALVSDLLCDVLVFDIETVPAVDLRKAPPTIAQAVGKHAERNEWDQSKVMSLSPYFGQIVSLAIGDGEQDPRTQDVTVFAVPATTPPAMPMHSPSWIRPVTEPELLRAFWALAGHASVVVSYNGRGFDVPFLIGRSLIHGVPIKTDLMSPPYSLRPHLDLFNVLAGGGSSYGRGPSSLDVVCWALGFASPKEAMDGSMVATAYAKGDLAQIALYNAGDVRATTAVYQRVRDGLLRFRDDW